KGNVNYMAFDGIEFIGLETVEFYLQKQSDGSYAGGEFQLKETTGNGLLLTTIDLKSPVNDCGVVAVVDEKSSYWIIFILGFLGGLFALITPCVFPLIPLTVSFFTKKEQKKSKGIQNAVLYGLFIFLIYI